ncbi:hypothetical protein V2J09_013336 [Rumex salicifolius]
MDLDNIECVSSLDNMIDDDEINQYPHPISLAHHHLLAHQYASSKPNGNGNAVVSNSTSHPATSVHELLEYPHFPSTSLNNLQIVIIKGERDSKTFLLNASASREELPLK